MEETLKWEYYVHTFGSVISGPKDDAFMDALNEWGEQGWEVISAENLDNTSKVRVIARRLLSRAASRSRTYPA